MHMSPARAQTLGGHRDDSERTLAAPIVALSLGCAAVFLLGGAEKADAPLAFVLRWQPARPRHTEEAGRPSVHAGKRIYIYVCVSTCVRPLWQPRGSGAATCP